VMRNRRALTCWFRLLGVAWACTFTAPTTVRTLQAAPAPSICKPDLQQVTDSVGAVRDTVPDPDLQAGGVPFMDIPTRADAAHEQLTRLAAKAQPKPDVTTLAATLADSLGLLDNLLAADGLVEVEQVSRLQVADMARGWMRQRTRLNRWKERVDVRWRGLTAAWDSTQRSQDLWNRTRNELELHDSSPVVRAGLIASVDGVLAHADTVEAILDQRLAFVVGMQRELSARRQAIDRTIRIMAEERPLVLHVDGLHNTDAASVTYGPGSRPRESSTARSKCQRARSGDPPIVSGSASSEIMTA